ncbi:MAG: hypothetical protein WBX25_37200 [Rhodomicrobium sp.]
MKTERKTELTEPAPDRIWSLKELQQLGYGHPCTIKRAAARGEIKVVKLSARRQGVFDSEVKRYRDSRSAA